MLSMKESSGASQVFTPRQLLSRRIRVFVSSTFRDMRAERRMLARDIFPEIRRFCHRHGVEFLEVDLRWGVTESQARSGETIDRCLDEVEDCAPFFLGMLGHRYGWQPTADDVPNAADDVARWIRGRLSATEMELRRGPLSSKFHDCASRIYLRHESLSREMSAVVRAGAKDFFEEEDSEPEARILALRKEIRKLPGATRRSYRDLESLRRNVLRDLQRFVTSYVKAMGSTPSEERSQVHCQKRLLSMVPETMGLWSRTWESVGARGLWRIVGPSGVGKSTCLAWGANRLTEQGTPFFAHFAQASPEAASVSAMALRLLEHLRFRGVDVGVIPMRERERIERMYEALARVPWDSPAWKGWTWIVDGLDWEPAWLPSSVRFVGSAAPSEARKAARCRRVPNPSSAERCGILESELKRHGKAVEPEELSALAATRISRTPLGARLAVDFLRVQVRGHRPESAIRRIESFASVSELVASQIRGVERIGTPGEVERTLKVLLAMPEGIPESDLLGHARCRGRTWSLLRDALGPLLVEFDGNCRIASADLVRELASRDEFRPDKELARSLFRKLDTKGRSVERKVALLPQLLRDDPSELGRFLARPDIFAHLAPHERRHRLLEAVDQPGVLLSFVETLVQTMRKARPEPRLQAIEFLAELGFGRQALELSATFRDASSSVTPKIRLRIADALLESGFTEAAIAVYLPLRGRFRGARLQCDLANNLGLAQMRGPSPEGALALFQESEALAREGNLPPLYQAAILHNQAQFHDLMGEAAARNRLLRSELDLLRRHFAPDHPLRQERKRDADALMGRASKGGDKAESDPRDVQARYGEVHLASAMAWHNRGVELASQCVANADTATLSQSEACFGRSLRIQRAIRGGRRGVSAEILRTRIERLECRILVGRADGARLRKELLTIAQDCSDYWRGAIPPRVLASLNRVRVSLLERHPPSPASAPTRRHAP